MSENYIYVEIAKRYHKNEIKYRFQYVPIFNSLHSGWIAFRIHLAITAEFEFGDVKILFPWEEKMFTTGLVSLTRDQRAVLENKKLNVPSKFSLLSNRRRKPQKESQGLLFFLKD